MKPVAKKCRRCRDKYIDKSINHHAVYCPSCRRLKWKLWKKTRNWETSPEGKAYQKAYQATYTEKYKKLVFDYYGWHCNCCAETLVSMLTIDHVNNDGASDRSRQLYKRIVEQKFPARYQVLCMNCNWSKKILKGICQHQLQK